MATIDNLDHKFYIDYARRMQSLESTIQTYHLDQASSIPLQTQILDLYPKLDEIDLLLGVRITQIPWAYFYPPPRYSTQRRSPFGFFGILPSFDERGDKEQKQEHEEEQKLEEIACSTKEQLAEKQILQNALSQKKRITNWVREIVGRIGQFLRG